MNFSFENMVFAYALARIVLGILIFFQAYDKIFNVKLTNVVSAYELPHNYPFSHFFVWTGTVITSYLELIAGPLLFVGLFTNAGLYLMAFDMVLVVMAFSAQNAMWDMRHVFPRLALLLFLLSVPETWNRFSADHLIFNF